MADQNLANIAKGDSVMQAAKSLAWETVKLKSLWG
jgi:hypothetical protein